MLCRFLKLQENMGNIRKSFKTPLIIFNNFPHLPAETLPFRRFSRSRSALLCRPPVAGQSEHAELALCLSGRSGERRQAGFPRAGLRPPTCAPRSYRLQRRGRRSASKKRVQSTDSIALAPGSKRLCRRRRGLAELTRRMRADQGKHRSISSTALQLVEGLALKKTAAPLAAYSEVCRIALSHPASPLTKRFARVRDGSGLCLRWSCRRCRRFSGPEIAPAFLLVVWLLPCSQQERSRGGRSPCRRHRARRWSPRALRGCFQSLDERTLLSPLGIRVAC